LEHDRNIAYGRYSSEVTSLLQVGLPYTLTTTSCRSATATFEVADQRSDEAEHIKWQFDSLEDAIETISKAKSVYTTVFWLYQSSGRASRSLPRALLLLHISSAVRQSLPRPVVYPQLDRNGCKNYTAVERPDLQTLGI